MENLADAFLRLDQKEIALLKAVERGMRTSEWAAMEDVVARARLSPKAAASGLARLVGKKLVSRTTEPYEGYQIGFVAYDLVALSDLVARDVVLSLGDLLGVGKESVVFEALGRIPPGADEQAAPPEWEEAELVPLAVKFHRQGRTSFKHVRRAREHLAGHPRCAWIHAARLGAAREWRTLKALHPEVRVPRPVALSHHALVMEHAGGTELYRVVLEEPETFLELILEEVASAWRRGFVHADLSAYNVLVGEEGEVVIIDWPQAVSRRDPRARELLERDVKNLLDHFARKYRLDLSLEAALSSAAADLGPGEEGGKEAGDGEVEVSTTDGAAEG